MGAWIRVGSFAVGLWGAFIFGTGQVSAQFALGRGDADRGRVLFERVWKSSTTLEGGDGLGPMFNERSCVACHYLGGIGGAGPNQNNVDILSIALPKDSKTVGRWSDRISDIHPGFSATSTNLVLHRFSSSAGYPEFRERVLGLTPPPGKDEQRLAALSAVRVQQGDGPIKTVRASRSNRGVDLLLSQRNTTPMFGAGEIDGINDTEIRAIAQSQANENDTVAGRFVGRFGWRGQVAHLSTFVRGACAVELGLNVPNSSQSLNPLRPTDRPTGLDLTDKECDDLTEYVARLPRPWRIPPADGAQASAINIGERLFGSIRCATCHQPSIGRVKDIFSDLLVHDMGSWLEDPFAAPLSAAQEYYGSSSPAVAAPQLVKHRREWKTPPLWGLRDSAPYLHDGRAATIEEAILWHGGEAKASVDSYQVLSATERSCILTFLSTLAAPEQTLLAQYAAGNR